MVQRNSPNDHWVPREGPGLAGRGCAIRGAGSESGSHPTIEIVRSPDQKEAPRRDDHFWSRVKRHHFRKRSRAPRVFGGKLL